MKKILIMALLAGAVALAADTGCGCGPAKAATAKAEAAPALPAGSIENLVPIGVAAALGCEPCTEEAVRRALAQGSSVEEVERALRVLGAVRKMDCFNRSFPEAVARMEKPLAAGEKVIEQARASAAAR